MVQDEVTVTEPLSSDLRRAMVDNQIRTFEVTDQRVLEAFYLVPREMFVPETSRSLAYSDALIPLAPAAAGEGGRWLLPPLFLARLLQGADINPTDRVLVVGCGTGYSTAVLARLAATVVALDKDAALCEAARAHMSALGLDAVTVASGPLAQGYKSAAPYDVILVDGAVECNLAGLLAQLAPEGRLVTIETRSSTATRRSGKAMRFDNVAGEISGRALFDATVPALAEFREPPAFVF